MRGLTCKPHTKFKPISANPPHQNSKLLKTMKQISIPQSIAHILKISDLNRLIENERIESTVEATRLRCECIDNLTALELLRQRAKSDLTAAMQKVEAARAALAQAQAALAPIATAQADADAKWQEKCSELMQAHGEGVVHAGMYRLHLYTQDAATKLNSLESSRFTQVTDHRGNPLYQYEKPGIQEKITEAADRLAELQRASKRIAGLVQARVSPDELADSVSAVLVAVGCAFPKKEEDQTIH